ncbi:MAG: ribonuclease P protein component [Sphingobacteriia bacterium]|nr:ribonuclease P protein component [Sphingobacteriia bacterium]
MLEEQKVVRDLVHKTQRFKLTTLNKTQDFLRLKKHGFKISSNFFLVCIADNNLLHPRLGIIATRKLGGAVVRNLLKRRIRSFAYETFKKDRFQSIDVLVIARRDLAKENYADIVSEFENAIMNFKKTKSKHDKSS